ncbi:hypothetical protein [Prauserella endophytica]|uniref:Uncharacterized protein n=1 Tax=Prauserella endophytica TaxID=1592324 RepID=A0ABY2RUZ1_9PSEU|nr:hypothetical protein [Prauserella endophytica]TKG61561.1 hypothetical protein FCN18_33525 [Prauserella endophytica]
MTDTIDRPEPGMDLAPCPVEPTTSNLPVPVGRPGDVPPMPWMDRVRQSHRLPEIVTSTQPSIADVVEKARIPEPGRAEPPPWLIGWTYTVTVPVKAAATLAGWLAEHPGRFIPAVVLSLIVSTALNQAAIPVFSWITPSFMDITTWF